MKFRPVEAELLYAAVSDRRTDGRTDVAKLILAFRDFANGTRRLWELVTSARKYSPN